MADVMQGAIDIVRARLKDYAHARNVDLGKQKVVILCEPDGDPAHDLWVHTVSFHSDSEITALATAIAMLGDVTLAETIVRTVRHIDILTLADQPIDPPSDMTFQFALVMTKDARTKVEVKNFTPEHLIGMLDGMHHFGSPELARDFASALILACEDYENAIRISEELHGGTSS